MDSCNGIWEDDLNLSDMEIPLWFKIPDNLKVSGEINLAKTNIYELPKNLQCESLYLNNCKNIKELPEDLHVQNILNIHNSSIERLPKNLQCKYLDLVGCLNIRYLPEGLIVEELHISRTKITIEYCEQLKQEGKIFYEFLFKYD